MKETAKLQIQEYTPFACRAPTVRWIASAQTGPPPPLSAPFAFGGPRCTVPGIRGTPPSGPLWTFGAPPPFAPVLRPVVPSQRPSGLAFGRVPRQLSLAALPHPALAPRSRRPESSRPSLRARMPSQISRGSHRGHLSVCGFTARTFVSISNSGHAHGSESIKSSAPALPRKKWNVLVAHQRSARCFGGSGANGSVCDCNHALLDLEGHLAEIDIQICRDIVPRLVAQASDFS
jgi:hypothetical protein